MFTKVSLIGNLTKNAYKQGSRLLWYTATIPEMMNNVAIDKYIAI